MKNVVEKCLECIERLTSNRNAEKVLKGFRARARSIPAEAAIRGTAYALTLIAARGSKEAIEIGLSAGNCGDVVSSIVGKNIDSEELSYWVYSAIVAYVMKSSGMVSSKNFKDLIKESMSSSVDIKAKMVFEWVKRLAEAYIAGASE